MDECSMYIPDDLFYTKTHQWVKIEDGVATVGLTDYAQKQLGEIVHIELKWDDELKGEQVSALEYDEDEPSSNPIAGVSVESQKDVWNIFAPVSGEIIEVNESLQDNPKNVNSDPYCNGWLFKIQTSNWAGEKDNLLAPDAYLEHEFKERYKTTLEKTGVIKPGNVMRSTYSLENDRVIVLKDMPSADEYEKTPIMITNVNNPSELDFKTEGSFIIVRNKMKNTIEVAKLMPYTSWSVGSYQCHFIPMRKYKLQNTTGQDCSLCIYIKSPHMHLENPPETPYIYLMEDFVIKANSYKVYFALNNRPYILNFSSLLIIDSNDSEKIPHCQRLNQDFLDLIEEVIKQFPFLSAGFNSSGVGGGSSDHPHFHLFEKKDIRIPQDKDFTPLRKVSKKDDRSGNFKNLFLEIKVCKMGKNFKHPIYKMAKENILKIVDIIESIKIVDPASHKQSNKYGYNVLIHDNAFYIIIKQKIEKKNEDVGPEKKIDGVGIPAVMELFLKQFCFVKIPETYLIEENLDWYLEQKTLDLLELVKSSEIQVFL